MTAKRKRNQAPPPKVDVFSATATPNAYARRIACDVAFLPGLGSALVGGEPPSYVLSGLIAHAPGAFFVGSPKRLRASRRAFEAAAPAWSATLENGAPPETCGALVVSELPREDPEEALERLIGAVGDGAPMLIDVLKPGPQDERRVVRIFEAACDKASLISPKFAPSDRLTLYGVRKAPFAPDVDAEAQAAAPITVIVAARRPRALESAIADVLVRQNIPPCRVLVLDLSSAPSDAAPEDLFGLRPGPQVEAALLVKHGESFGDALDDALAAVETPYVAIVDDDAAGFAANHFAMLGLALEASPAATAAFSDVVERGRSGEPRGLRRARPADLRDPFSAVALRDAFPLSAGLWRTDALRALGGCDPSFGRAAGFELRLRAATGGSFVVAPVPSTAVDGDRRDETRRAAADDSRRAAAAAVERRTLKEAVAAGAGANETERTVDALATIAAILCRAGDGANAAKRLKLAEEKAPGTAVVAAGFIRAARAGGPPPPAPIRKEDGGPGREAGLLYAAGRAVRAGAFDKASSLYAEAAEGSADPRIALFNREFSGREAAGLSTDDLSAFADACDVDSAAHAAFRLRAVERPPGTPPPLEANERCAADPR